MNKKEYKDLTEKEKEDIRIRNRSIFITIGIVIILMGIFVFWQSCDNAVRGLINLL